MEQRYFTETELAELTSIAVQTLRNQRSEGRGFPYVKFGRSVRYPIADDSHYGITQDRSQAVEIGAGHEQG